MSETIKAVIKPDGKVFLEASGFQGTTCYDVTEKINLGTTIKDIKKEEAYEKIPRVRRVNVGR